MPLGWISEAWEVYPVAIYVQNVGRPTSALDAVEVANEGRSSLVTFIFQSTHFQTRIVDVLRCADKRVTPVARLTHSRLGSCLL